MDTDVAADDAVVNIVGRFVGVADIWQADIPLDLLQSKILKEFPLSKYFTFFGYYSPSLTLMGWKFLSFNSVKSNGGWLCGVAVQNDTSQRLPEINYVKLKTHLHFNYLQLTILGR